MTCDRYIRVSSSSSAGWLVFQLLTFYFSKYLYKYAIYIPCMFVGLCLFFIFFFVGAFKLEEKLIIWQICFVWGFLLYCVKCISTNWLYRWVMLQRRLGLRSAMTGIYMQEMCIYVTDKRSNCALVGSQLIR